MLWTINEEEKRLVVFSKKQKMYKKKYISKNYKSNSTSFFIKTGKTDTLQSMATDYLLIKQSNDVTKK